jgi:hypothetical protein
VVRRVRIDGKSVEDMISSLLVWICWARIVVLR